MLVEGIINQLSIARPDTFNSTWQLVLNAPFVHHMPPSILETLRLKFVIVDYIFATDYYTSASGDCTSAINAYISAINVYIFAIAVYIPAIDGYIFEISDFRLAINDCKLVLKHFK